MKISLSNIGKIKKAEVELRGITVIAGKNDTGKSTVGKALYSMIRGLSRIEERIHKERIKIIQSVLEEITLYPHYGSLRNTLVYYDKVNEHEIAEKIIKNSNLYIEDIEALKGLIWEMGFKFLSKNFSISSDKHRLFSQYQSALKNISIEEENVDFIQESALDYKKDINNDGFKTLMGLVDAAAEDIIRILTLSFLEIKKALLSRTLQTELSGQINPILKNHNPSESSDITVEDGGWCVKSKIKSNSVSELTDHAIPNMDILYLETPFILDEMNEPNDLSHGDLDRRKMLCRNLRSMEKLSVIQEVLYKEDLNNLIDLINSVAKGEITYQGMHGEFIYQSEEFSEMIQLKNLSTGLKTFVIIKRLLFNNSLKKGGVIILDEPEVHVHPEWQLKLAEVIVLLQKHFDMTVLLNTHSPHFLRAIEVYSARHKIADKCKYYLADVEQDQAIIKDISDNIELAYGLLFEPLQMLEEVRW